MSQIIAQSESPFLDGVRLIAIAAFIGFVVCLIYYFAPHGTIAHQWGTLLVLISIVLMLGASCWMSFWEMPRWLHNVFVVLIVLDIVGIGVCAYFLEAPALLILMLIALVGWIWQLAAPAQRISAS